MGLFDTFKGMVQAVTGGAARVAIEFDPLGFAGEEVRVRVSVASTGGEVKSQGVFVDIIASEQIKVPAASVASAVQNPSRPMAEAMPTAHQTQLARGVELNHVTCSQ